MTQRSAVRLAALAGFSAVALGAFGAHGLKQVLTQNNSGHTWDTAVLYHLIHALAMFMVAGQMPSRRGPLLLFATGIVLFSCSLYLLALTNIRWLGAITPLGGLCFLAGWLWLMVAPNAAAPSLPPPSSPKIS